jgi:hypothetical protein
MNNTAQQKNKFECILNCWMSMVLKILTWATQNHEHQIFAGNPYVRKTFYNSINRTWDYRKKELERFQEFYILQI